MASFLARLPRRIAEILSKNNVNTAQNIILTSDSDLLKLGNLSLEDVKLMKDESASCLLSSKPKTVLDLMEINDHCNRISLGCPEIDVALRGGLRRGTITELSAESGCGKTQICLQVAARAWKTGAVYICTEELFPSNRLHQLFMALHNTLPKNEQLLNKESYGENIFVQRIAEVIELKRCVGTNLKRLLETKKNISVIILDSITAPFRGHYHQVHSGVVRAQELKEIAMSLLDSAIKYNVAVLCVNQVTSPISSDNTPTEPIPSLGLAWANVVSTRFIIKRKNKFITCHNQGVMDKTKGNVEMQVRQLEVAFAPDLYSGPAAEFIITGNGVVGLNV